MVYDKESYEEGSMDMPNYWIVASDLDGTLLNSEMRVSRENEEAIRRMVAEGVYFVPSSGRSLYEMPREVVECPYVRYLIHSDGAAVYDKVTGESIRLAMTREKSRQMMEILSEYEVDISTRHDGHCYVDARKHTREYHYDHRMDEYWVNFVMDYFEPIENFDRVCDFEDGIEMVCVFFKDAGELEECRRRFREMGGYGIASSDPANLEIYDERAGKGSALLCLARKLGIDPSQTIAVGDSLNDRDMVIKAGLGLAMENACEELKAVAKEVVCNNEEHVMGYILEHYIQ